MSTLIKEWLLKTIAELEEERDAVPGAVNEDATMALAAMKIALASLEAEAVSINDDMAYAFHHALSDSSLGADEVEEIKAGLRAAFANVTAPPAPVAPDEMTPQQASRSYGGEVRGYRDGWNACRSAMLHGADGTLTNEGTIPVTQFKPVADLYGLTSPAGSETSFTFDAVEARDFIDGGWSCREYVELGRFQEAMLQNGNSPAQSDCCPEQNYIAPAQDGNSAVIADCSCRTCRPVTFSDSRFVVCPECGNKRCPHANDHRNACTGSNEPGQEGSAYPAAPQQEVESQIRKGKTVAMEEWELGARLTKHRFKP
ncbi:hypothetical protein ABKU24_12470 [Enterobacter hormaechei]